MNSYTAAEWDLRSFIIFKYSQETKISRSACKGSDRPVYLEIEEGQNCSQIKTKRKRTGSNDILGSAVGWSW